MDQPINEKERRKKVLKDIIRRLHHGLPVEEAKDIFEREIGTISSLEIADIEQSLINEGMSPDEVKKFCNVHALLFKSALLKVTAKQESKAHPIHLFKLENREIEKITNHLKELIKERGKYKGEQLKHEINHNLDRLRGVDLHYVRKEQLLFPFLEKYGFMGPSKVMWGKDNEIRDIFRNALSKIDEPNQEEYIDKYLNPLIEEVEGMIFKEENILFPTSLEKLNTEDWIDILKDSNEVGYVFIEEPKETSELVRELKKTMIEDPNVTTDGAISLPSGELKLKELMCILNTLPIDITFVDKDDVVKYFSETKDKVFLRPRSVIGRKVQNCHPPQSLDVVEKIVSSFKEGKRDNADFWIKYRGRFAYIRYFAVREQDGNYLGTIEVNQDIGNIKKIEGEKRLLDEK